jgi:HTH-type transcriptional regulator, sugar sensing transcriptional regulator
LLQDKEIKTLMDLGLTVIQAKTYLTLVKLGESTIKEVAKASDVARQNIYQIMPTLQQLGLVERIMGSPSSYKATPIETAISILLQYRNKKSTELQEQAKKLVDNFHTNNFKISLHDENDQFIVTSEGVLLQKRLVNQLHNAQTSIDTVSTWKVCTGMISYYAKDIKQIMKRGVRFRAFTDNNPENKTPKFLEDLQKNPHFEIRYSTSPVTIKMTIRDRKEVNVCVSTTPNRGFPNMWSDNPVFAKLATDSFEYMWDASSEEKTITSQTKNVKHELPKKLAPLKN